MNAWMQPFLVIPMLIVTIPMDLTIVLVIVGTMEMGHTVLVSSYWLVIHDSSPYKHLISIDISILYTLECYTIYHVVKAINSLIDINECLNATNPCHTNAICNNTDGSYTCTCNSGFYGNGRNCTGEYLSTYYSWVIHI